MLCIFKHVTYFQYVAFPFSAKRCRQFVDLGGGGGISYIFTARCRCCVGGGAYQGNTQFLLSASLALLDKTAMPLSTSHACSTLVSNCGLWSLLLCVGLKLTLKFSSMMSSLRWRLPMPLIPSKLNHITVYCCYL
jgi:hypothetical protein